MGKMFSMLQRSAENGFNRMHPVLCLIKHDGVFTAENFIRDFTDVIAFFHLLRGHLGLEIVEGRQAVHKQNIWISGGLHHLYRHFKRR